MTRVRSLLVPIAAIAALLVGCTLLANPTFDAALQAVIDVVIGALLNKNPAAAATVATDATALAQLAGGNSVSVAALETQADNVIAASSLSVADKAAMEDLVAAAEGLLVQESSAIPANAQSGLQLVFTDMANAANLYASVGRVGARIGVVTGSIATDIQNAANLLH